MDSNFIYLLNSNNYENLEFVRTKTDPHKTTDANMKLSANKFCNLLADFGFEQEADQVFSFLKGIGSYDSRSKTYFFTIYDLMHYRQILLGKCAKNKFETDYDYLNFFFKSIATEE